MSANAVPTPAEKAVLLVLHEVIGDTTISSRDDFYEVGGHSLLILQVTRRLKIEHGLDLDLRQFWRNSRISALVAACVSVPQQEAP